jgi:hypothetical protein
MAKPASSLTMVLVTEPAPGKTGMAGVAVVMLTWKVSSASTALSPATLTVKVLEVSAAVKVSGMVAGD